MKNKTNFTGIIIALLISSLYITQGQQPVGVYASVDFRDDADASAKVAEFIDVSRGSDAYIFRNAHGTQVLVDVARYRGAIYYPSPKSLATDELSKKKLIELQAFVKKFPKSTNYLSTKIIQLSSRIEQMDKLAKEEISPAEGKDTIASLVLKNGKVYKNVTISKLPDGITVLHRGGVATIPHEDLPDSLIAKLGGFDPDEVREYRKPPEEKWKDQEKVLRLEMEKKELIFVKEDEIRKRALREKMSQLVKPFRPDHGQIDRIIEGRILNVLNDGILISVGEAGVCKVEINSEEFVDDQLVSDIVELTDRRFQYTAVSGALKTVPVYVPVSKQVRDYLDLNDKYMSTKNSIESELMTIESDAVNRNKESAALLKLKEKKFLQDQATYRSNK